MKRDYKKRPLGFETPESFFKFVKGKKIRTRQAVKGWFGIPEGYEWDSDCGHVLITDSSKFAIQTGFESEGPNTNYWELVDPDSETYETWEQFRQCVDPQPGDAFGYILNGTSCGKTGTVPSAEIIAYPADCTNFKLISRKESNMINMNKQYKTRGGDEVRIYAVDGEGDWPVHGAVKLSDKWKSVTWTLDGIFYEQNQSHSLDLVEVKPRIKREVWMNVYENSSLNAYKTKEQADKCASYNRLACVKVDIDVEEGEGI